MRFADEDFVGSQKSHGRRRNFEHTSAPLAQELQEAAARAAELAGDGDLKHHIEDKRKSPRSDITEVTESVLESISQ